MVTIQNIRAFITVCAALILAGGEVSSMDASGEKPQCVALVISDKEWKLSLQGPWIGRGDHPVFHAAERAPQARATHATDLEVKVGQPVLVTSSESVGGASCNFPTIGRLLKGQLVVFFGSSPDEIHPEKQFGGFCISRDGGRTWDRRLNRSHWVASKIALDDGRLLTLDYDTWTAEKDDPRHFFTYAHWFSEGFDREEVRKVRINLDRDYDLRWSQFAPNPKHLTPVGKLKCQMGPMINNSIVEAKDGSLLASAYGYCIDDRREYDEIKGYELYKHVANRSFLLKSKDKGLTWSYHSTIAAWRDVEHVNAPGTKWTIEGPNETSIVRLRDGRLLAVFRSWGQSYSSDDGKTWTKPVNIMERGAKAGKFHPVGVQPRLLLLANGVVALAGGGGHDDYPGRRNLIVFSMDGKGEKWSHHTMLGDPTKATTGYTDIVEVEPGKLLYVYDEAGSTEIWCVPIEVKLKKK